MAKQARTEGRSPTWRVGFVGGGNMAAALIKGLLAAGVHPPEEIVASDIDGTKLAGLRRRFKIATAADNLTLVRRSRVVVLAVKPQIMDGVLAQLRPAVTPQKLFVSIAAGVSTSRLEQRLGPGARVLRVMPNTPALLGQGMSVLVRGRHASARDERTGLRLLRAVGDALAVGEERLLDPVTGLSGSGPAYVYLFAEGLIAGGVASGLAPDLARRLAYQTLAGAAAMLRETGETPEALRAMVTSPGGTTFAGLGVLQERGFKDAVIAAVVAASRRAEELGRPTG